ncbi:MAG: hypothetical protein ABIQ43_04965 [Sphingomonas sp.]
MFNKIAIASLAVIGMISSGPVLAAGKNNDQSAISAKEQPESNTKTRYCARTEMVTGSIRQGRVCKTADEWRAEGVDATKLQTRN